jgi:hypothetical protein
MRRYKFPIPYNYIKIYISWLRIKARVKNLNNTTIDFNFINTIVLLISLFKLCQIYQRILIYDIYDMARANILNDLFSIR